MADFMDQVLTRIAELKRAKITTHDKKGITTYYGLGEDIAASAERSPPLGRPRLTRTFRKRRHNDL